MGEQGLISSRQNPRAAVPLPKIPSCICGLDEILQGGFPEGRTTLVGGGPGTGKTLLTLEFLYRSAKAGQAGVLVSFEERAAAIRQNVLSFAWDLAALEESGRLFLFEARLDREAIFSGSFNIKPLLAIIQGQARAIGARRIVIDALDVFMRVFHDGRRERDEMYGLHDWLLDNGFTTIMTVKKPDRQANGYPYEFLDYMADSVISLDQQAVGQVTTRRLRVVKYRGSKHSHRYHRFLISDQGIRIAEMPGEARPHLAGNRTMAVRPDVIGSVED